MRMHVRSQRLTVCGCAELHMYHIYMPAFMQFELLHMYMWNSFAYVQYIQASQ
jgi:hypothetical protein